MSQQKILSLSLTRPKTFDNFFGNANQLLLKYLKNLEPGKSAYLWGISGTGCSHLLKAACAYWQAQSWYTVYLDLARPHSYKILMDQGLPSIQLLALDHIDEAVKKTSEAKDLFALFNRCQELGCVTLWGAHQPASTLSVALADLHSRLNSIPVFQLRLLDDLELKEALKCYADQQGFHLPTPVIQFLLTHYPRNLSELLNILDQLSMFSLQRKKKLSLPVVRLWEASKIQSTAP